MNRESFGGSYQNIKSYGEQNGNYSIQANRSSRGGKSFKLYVSNIPVRFDSTEFERIFSIVAAPTSVYLAPPSAPNSRFKWGFVEFNSISDAEAAIEKLDGKDPHRLNIKFAVVPNKNSNNPKSSYNKKESNDNRRRSNLPASREGSSSSDVNDIVDKSMERDGYYRSKPRHNQPRSKIKNIHVQIADNGKKTVKAEFENRLIDGVSVGSCDSALNFTMNLVALDFCQVCSRDARKKCGACGTAYCSEKCASSDWKIHKTKCSIELSKPSATSSPISRDIKLERLDMKNDKPIVNTNISDQSYNRDDSDKRHYRQEMPHKHMNGESQPLNQKIHNSQSVKPNQDNTLPIPADTFTKVLAMYLEEEAGNVWVVSEKQRAFSLHTQLQEYCGSIDAKPIIKPCVGMLCAALFEEENEWFRAEIISIDPCLKVRCLDYGNEEKLSLDLLRTLSPELSAIKPLAFKIKFLPEYTYLLKKLIVPAAISVKAIKICDGECLVAVDNSNDETTSVPNSDTPPVPKNEFSKVIISYASDKNVYWVQKVCDLKASVDLLGRVNSHCKSSPPINIDDIKTGQIYGALFEELWYRGEILAVKPFIKVCFIDFGNEEVCSASDIKKLSEDLIALPPYAFKIELASGTSDKYSGLLEEERLLIKPLTKSGNAWVVQVENDSSPSNTLIETETPSIPKLLSTIMPAPNHAAPPSTPSRLLYTSFTKVTVVYPASETEYWVLKSSDFQSYINLSTNVNKVCQSARPVNQPEIVKNSIYGAKFEDAWYRALVMETKPAIKVRFIDYGNDEICSAEDMRKLTQELLAVPPCVLKISLAPGTSDKYHGLIESDELSVKVISQEGDTLVVCVQDDPSSIAPHESVIAEKAVKNEKPEIAVKVAATPDPAPYNDDSTIQRPTPLPMNSFTQVFVSVQVKSSTYWVFKGADMAQNNSILVELNKYCSSTEARPLTKYTVGSLCSAMYEGDWYRGKILAIEPEIVIRFIDYGNEESCSKESLKSLPPDLATLPPLAFKISLAEGTVDKYHNLGFQSVLSVKPVKKIDDVWIVTVENEVYTDNVTKSISSGEKVSPDKASVNGSFSSTSVITPTVSNGFVTSKSLTTTIFKQQPPIPTDKFSSVAISYWCEPDIYWMYKPSELSNMDAIITQTNDYCNSSLASHVQAPIPGLLCSALFEGEWYRAKIVSMEPNLKVFFIDFGNEEICSMNDIRDIPPKLVSFPSLVFKVRLAEGTSQRHHNLPAGDNLKIRPVSQFEDAWIVQVENDTYEKSPPAKTVTFKSDSIDNNDRKEPTVATQQNEKTDKPTSPIPTDSFTKVLVTFHVEGCTYWVNKYSDLSKVKKILEDVDAHCKSSRADKIPNPTPGTLCSALYEGEWYRGLILTCKPALLIKFVDFGNDDICTSDDIRTLPQELSTVPYLAFQIRLADGTPSKYSGLPFQAEISVKPVSWVHDCWVVHVENEVYDSVSTPLISKVKEASTTKKVESQPSSVTVQSKNEETLPSLVDSLPNTLKRLSIDKAEPPVPRNTFTEVVVMHPINSTSSWVILESQAFLSDRILTDLTKHCISNFSQKVTELKSNMKCAAKYGDDWCRAQVLSVEPLQVKFVDYGNVEEVSLSDIRVLPHEMLKIKPLAFMIKLDEEASAAKSKAFQLYSKIFIKPESRDKDGGWIVTVNNGNNESLEEATFNDSKISFKSESRAEPPQPAPSAKSKTTNSNSAGRAEHSFLPFNTFSSVNVVLCNAKDDYWVNLTSSMKSMLQMTNKLGSLSHDKVIPIVGKTYVTFYEDCWCRAKVVNLSPLKVFYIDYGNEESIEASDLRPLPPEFINTPPFAFRIKLNEGTSEKYHNINDMETSISVRPISKTLSGTYVVQVEGDRTSTPSIETTATKGSSCSTSAALNRSDLSDHSTSGDEGDVKHMLDVALKKSKCDLLVNRVWSNVHMSCSLLVPGKHAEQLTHLKQRIENLPLSQLYSGKVGSFVGCLNKDQVHGRGLLLSCASSCGRPIVAMVDLGYTSEVELLSPLPLALEQIPHASVSCRFKAPQNDIEIGSILKCSNLKSIGEFTKCQVYSRGECRLSVWKPEERTLTLATIDVPSGSRVILSAISETCDIVYIQSMAEENIDNLRQTIKQTCICARNESQPCTGVEVGDMVACLFAEDNNYYRAVILNEKNKKYTVRFLDFGNTCEAFLKDFKILSDDIKKLPCCSVQVRLDGVGNVPIVPEIESILNDHIDAQTVYTINHENLMNAKLTTVQGSSLNDELKRITSKITPVSPGTVSNSKIMLDHVKFVEWPVGVKLDLIILSKLSTNSFLTLNNKDPHLNDVRSYLTEKLSTYATTNFPSDYTYKPVLNEVVLCLFHEDNQWYRAHCIKENAGDNYEIVFIDYGNIACVNSCHIRPMTREHLDAPVIIRSCKIHGIPDEVTPETEDKLNSLFSEGSLHQVFVIKDSSQNGVTVYHPALVSKVNEKIIELPPIHLPDSI